MPLRGQRSPFPSAAPHQRGGDPGRVSARLGGRFEAEGKGTHQCLLFSLLRNRDPQRRQKKVQKRLKHHEGCRASLWLHDRGQLSMGVRGAGCPGGVWGRAGTQALSLTCSFLSHAQLTEAPGLARPRRGASGCSCHLLVGPRPHEGHQGETIQAGGIPGRTHAGCDICNETCGTGHGRNKLWPQAGWERGGGRWWQVYQPWEWWWD